METSYNLKNTTIKQVCLVVLCILAGWILLTAAYSIPTARINDNIENSARYFKETYPRFTFYGSTQLDLFTDALMLLTSGYNNTEPSYVASLLNNRIGYSGKNPAQTLYHAYSKNNEINSTSADSPNVISYARYWHGYASILKPLLACPGLHYGHIRSINTVIQLGLFALFCVGLIKLHKIELVPAFVICWVFMNPLCTTMCLQFSTCTIITFFSLNYIVYKLAKGRENLPFCGIFFTCIGIVTSYLDLLTFPLITLGIPLLTYMCLRDEKDSIPLFESVKKIVFLGWSWCIGYAGMWAGKWVLATLVTDENIIANAYNAMLIRASSVNKTDHFNVLDVLVKQVHAMDLIVLISFVFAIICSFYILFRKYGKTSLKENSNAVLYLLIMIMPVFWYSVLKNHAYMHGYFTYRNLAVSVLAIMLILTSFLKTKEERIQV